MAVNCLKAASFLCFAFRRLTIESCESSSSPELTGLVRTSEVERRS